MRKKWYLVALLVMVGVGFAFAGCKKSGGDPKAAEALCQKMAEEAMAVQMEKMPAGVKMPADEMAKGVETAKKGCVEQFTNAPEDEKPIRYKQAEEKLEKCKDKKGEEFVKCFGE